MAQITAKATIHDLVRQYALAIGVSFFAVLLIIASPAAAPAALLIFLLGVAVSAWYGGVTVGVFTALLLSVLADYYILPPKFTFKVPNAASTTGYIEFLAMAGLICVLINILRSTRRRYEYERDSSSQRMEALMEGIPQIVWTITPDTQLEFVNEQWIKYTGMSRQKSQGRGWQQAIHQDDLSGVSEKMREAISSNQEFSMEYRIRSSAGDYRWFVGKANPVRNAEGEVLRWFGTCTDIHTQKTEETAQRFMSESSRLLGSSLDYQTTIQNLADMAVPHMADWCAVDIVSGPGQLERLAVAHVDPEKVALAHRLAKQYPSDPESETGVWKVIKSGQSELITSIPPEAYDAIPDPEQREIYRQLDLHSVINAPLIAAGKVIGAITFVSAESGRIYTTKDLATLEDLGLRAGVAIGHAQAYSEMQRIGTELRRSSSQMEAILTTVGDGIIVSEPDGKLVFANNTAAEVSGYTSAEELVERSRNGNLKTTTMIDAEYRPLEAGMLPRHQAAKGEYPESVIIGYQIEESDQTRWSLLKSAPIFGEDNQVAYVVTVFTDITAIRNAQEISSRLAAIVRSSEDAIFSKNLEGIITTWNAGAQKMYGYAPDEAIGRHVSFLEAEVHDTIQITKRAASNESLDHYETVRRRKDGEVINVSLTISPLHDDAGNVTGASVIARNITEQKRLEAQKDEFITVASHELKSPVTSMKIYSQSLLRAAIRRGASDSEIEQLEAVNRQTEKLVGLVKNLLDANKLEHGQIDLQPKVVGIKELVEETVEHLAPTVATHKIVVSGENVKTYGDPDRLEQVLTNLINNAVQHSPAGSDIQVSIAKSKRQVHISVTDQGEGIPHDKIEGLFERFFQVDSSRSRGVGLGLYIAQRIMKQHNGEITVVSELGRGSTFTINLPQTKIREGAYLIGLSKS